MQYKDKTVVDICCGFGHFADIFEDDKYTGYDISDAMIDLAYADHPLKQFIEADFTGTDFTCNNADVVFEVNSLHSLGKTPDEFYAMFKDYAPTILCLECDVFTFFENGEKREIIQSYRR